MADLVKNSGFNSVRIVTMFWCFDFKRKTLPNKEYVKELNSLNPRLIKRFTNPRLDNLILPVDVY